MPSPGEWRFFKRAQCVMPDSMDVITVLSTGWSASTAKTCSILPFSGSIWQRCEEKSISSCRHGRFGWSGWLVVPSFRPVGLPTEPNASAALSRSSHHLRCVTSSDGFSLLPAPHRLMALARSLHRRRKQAGTVKRWPHGQQANDAAQSSVVRSK